MSLPTSLSANARGVHPILVHAAAEIRPLYKIARVSAAGGRPLCQPRVNSTVRTRLRQTISCEGPGEDIFPVADDCASAVIETRPPWMKSFCTKVNSTYRQAHSASQIFASLVQTHTNSCPAGYSMPQDDENRDFHPSYLTCSQTRSLYLPQPPYCVMSFASCTLYCSDMNAVIHRPLLNSIEPKHYGRGMMVKICQEYPKEWTRPQHRYMRHHLLHAKSLVLVVWHVEAYTIHSEEMCSCDSGKLHQVR